MNFFNKQKIIVKNLAKTFIEINLPVIENVSLNVKQEEFVSVIGPSGCGKSTLLDCIAGLVTPDTGEITIEGKPAYMFQDDVMLPWRNVLDNLSIPLEIAGVKRVAARKEAMELLEKFELKKFSGYYPFMLSGGMRERVSLLRTHLCKKDVMLLDEPFSKLDALTRLQMQQWFLDMLHLKKQTVLFVTHDIDEAILLSDRIYVISKRPCKVLAEIPISMHKPRSMNVMTSKEFINIKKDIMLILNNA